MPIRIMLTAPMQVALEDRYDEHPDPHDALWEAWERTGTIVVDRETLGPIRAAIEDEIRRLEEARDAALTPLMERRYALHRLALIALDSKLASRAQEEGWYADR